VNLRLPIAASVVTVAVAVTCFRSFHRDAAGGPPPSAAGMTFETAAAVPRGAGLQARGAVVRPARLTVYVAGNVARAGVYALPAASRAVDALRAAGGATRDADLVAVNLAAPVADGEEIVVPAKGAGPSESRDTARLDGRVPARSSRGTHRRRRAGHRKRRASSHSSSGAAVAGAPDPSDPGGADPAAGGDAAPSETIDLNTADENELETLPGIGPSLASRIVLFREINGSFASVDDLLDVGGMTQGRLDAIEPYVTTR